MATKRKVKRYEEGGDIAAANESDDPIAYLNKSRGWTDTGEDTTSTRSMSTKSTPETKKDTFKEAFASARRAGDKTFEWNGKKFTTEVASKEKPKSSEQTTTTKYETSYDRMNRENREQGRDFDSLVSGLKNRIMSAGSRGSALPLKSTKSESGNKFMGAGMKGGGKVSTASRRGDGIAVKGKTKGRFV